MSASFDHHFADDSFFDSGFDAFRSHDRDTIGTSRSRGRSAASSYESEASRPAAYSGFSDMPAGSRYDTGPDFTEPFFPGMHGDDRTAGARYQVDSPRYVEAEQERPFFMRRADTASSSRSRSDSSQFYPENLRRALATARTPPDSTMTAEDIRRPSGCKSRPKLPGDVARLLPCPPTLATPLTVQHPQHVLLFAQLLRRAAATALPAPSSAATPDVALLRLLPRGKRGQTAPVKASVSVLR
jgi:hypothetical protein